MRKALVVGIDHYQYASPLFGCVDDAHSVRAVLERHSDGSVNFGVRLLTGTGPTDLVARGMLRDAVNELFAGDSDAALFYFAGHGAVDVTGGYIATSETDRADGGLPIADVLTLANLSRAKNKIVVLDSCHSGIAGERPLSAAAELTEGLTILTASTAEQYATEENGSGVFTRLFVDALSGSACNLLGDVTPGSVYAHIDQSLGPWEQRPVFKTNVKSFVSLRRVQPPIQADDLRRLVELFPAAGHVFALDPTFEPERGDGTSDLPAPVPENTARFAILQKYNRVNLVVPVDAPHMYHAAIHSTGCRLTALGEHYRRLVAKGRI